MWLNHPVVVEEGAETEQDENLNDSDENIQYSTVTLMQCQYNSCTTMHVRYDERNKIE